MSATDLITLGRIGTRRTILEKLVGRVQEDTVSTIIIPDTGLAASSQPTITVAGTQPTVTIKATVPEDEEIRVKVD